MIDSPPSSTTLDLICMKKWKKAKEGIQIDPVSLYSYTSENKRLLIHDLCKLVTLPACLMTSGEMSDDEDEDSPEEERGCLPCHDCSEEDNKGICELAKIMIDKSHMIGPVKVHLPELHEDESVAPQTTQDGGDEDPVTAPSSDKGPSYQVHRSILTVPDSMGKTPLHVLCEHNADTNLMKVIFESSRDFTKNANAPTVLSLILAKDSRGATPLHYLAYSRSCPISSLKLMMDYCKPFLDKDHNLVDPTISTDIDGDTPLHWALDGYMSPRRLQQLVRHSKLALTMKNAAGRRPFDHFAVNFVDADWQEHELPGKEAWENIQAYLRVLDDQPVNEEGTDWLPVHMLARSPIDFPRVFADIALHFNKEDFSKPDSLGMLPLHLACARQGLGGFNMVDNSILVKILSSYPQGAYKKGGRANRLPLHYALETNKPLQLIGALLKAYPNSMNVKDPTTGLWPFLLAGAENNENIDTTYSLLRADPSILQIAIKAQARKSSQRSYRSYKMEPDEVEEHSARRLRRLAIREDNY